MKDELCNAVIREVNILKELVNKILQYKLFVLASSKYYYSIGIL